jgi:hypothetical protein
VVDSQSRTVQLYPPSNISRLYPTDTAQLVPYHCPICPFFAADRFSPVLRHIGAVHAFEPGISVTRGLDGCQATYKKFSSYETHLYRKNRAVEVEGGTNEYEGGDRCACVVENSMDYCCDESEPVAQDTAAAFRDSGAKFILRMRGS